MRPIISSLKRLLFRSRTAPFWICVWGVLVLFLLEKYPSPAWKSIKPYFLDSPFFYHSLVLYLVALVLALFTYRNLFNVKILLASFLFLMIGVYSLLYFLGMPTSVSGIFKLQSDERAHTLIYFYYSLGLFLVALVPTYLTKTVTRVLLVLLVLCEGFILFMGSRFLLPVLGAHLADLWARPMMWLAVVNLIVAVISFALSFWRKDPSAWTITGFLVLFTLAYQARDTDLEKLFLHWVPISLTLTVLINLTSSLSHRANYDPLLRIYSRGYCDNFLHGKGRSLGREFALAMFDLDRFKKINDKYGHAVGDTVLYLVAQKIREKALPRGITCRYGGEEILVVFPQSNLEYAERIAREVVSSVAQLKIPFSGKRKSGSLRITVSGGVVAGQGGRNSVKSLLESADKALYRSKRLGRNRLSVSKVKSR